MPEIEFDYLGKTCYQEAMKIQRERVEEIKYGFERDILIFLEHEDIITIGRRGKMDELLTPLDKLKNENIQVVYTDRGGGLTAHGPGQLVIYSIFNMSRLKIPVKNLISKITGAIKTWLNLQGLTAVYDDIHPGLYIEGRKILFIGLKLDNYVTYHGFALNLNQIPRGFNYIIPCSMQNCQITSLYLEVSRKYDIKEVSYELYRYICHAINGD